MIMCKIIVTAQNRKILYLLKTLYSKYILTETSAFQNNRLHVTEDSYLLGYYDVSLGK